MASSQSAAVALRERLERINSRIAAHPLNSEQFLRARAVVSQAGDAERSEVDATLREQGLPGLGAQTKMMMVGLASLARLNRKRIRLEEKLSAIGGPAGA